MVVAMVVVMAEGTVADTVVVITVVVITAVVIMVAGTSAVAASVTRISVADAMAARGSEPSRDTPVRASARSAMRPCIRQISAMR
jgi:hypothetical protein